MILMETTDYFLMTKAYAKIYYNITTAGQSIGRAGRLNLRAIGVLVMLTLSRPDRRRRASGRSAGTTTALRPAPTRTAHTAPGSAGQ